MITARRHSPARAQRPSVSRTAATLAATAALLAFSFTAAPAQAASAATPITDANSLAAAFAAGGTVTLDADITVPSSGPALAVTTGHPVTLDLNGQDLTATGDSELAGIGVPAGTALIIIDSGIDGALNATGGESAAGIGGGFGEASGAVSIDGGFVTAQGGTNAAGIGGGAFGQSGNITITGGTVTAQGGSDIDPSFEAGGAGIGGGFLGSSGTTIITGGTVAAQGGGWAAGIGGGYDGDGGTTTISGGTVTAQGGNLGAGIGGGNGGDGGTTTITGGTVTAQGGIYGAGIGGGWDGAGGIIAITGGVVTVNGGRESAAIGGGHFADGGTVTIGAGAQVTVTASSVPGSFLIGGGSDTAGFGSLSNAGTLTITAGSTLVIPAGITVLNLGTIVNAGSMTGTGTITNTGAIVNTGSVGPTLDVGISSFLLSFDTVASPTPATIAPLRVYANTLAAAQLTLPVLTAVAHHSFSWVTNASPPVAFTPTTVLTGDLTLYPQWTLDRHTVTFDAQGGSAVGPLTTDYGTTITAPSAPTRAGFTFNGWFSAVTGGTAWDFAPAVLGDATLYAQWTAVAVVTPPTTTPTATPTPTPTPSASPKPVSPALASTGFDGGAAGFGALVVLLAGLAVTTLRRRRVTDV